MRHRRVRSLPFRKSFVRRMVYQCCFFCASRSSSQAVPPADSAGAAVISAIAPGRTVEQRALVSILCGSSTAPACSPKNLLPRTVARFKTPTVRDLGHSNPYFHTGGAATLENVLAHYFRASNFARMDKLRNGASELKTIRLSADDRTRVVAFLRALNEDYH